MVYIDPQPKEQGIWPKTTTPSRLPSADTARFAPGETPRYSAGMTPEQLAEAKQYGRYLAGLHAGRQSARPAVLDLCGGRSRPAAGRLAARLVAAGKVLLPCGWSCSSCWSRCSTWPSRCRFRSIPATSWNIASTSAHSRWAAGCGGTSKQNLLGLVSGHGADSRLVLADLDDPRLVVAGGRRGLFLRHDHPGPDLPRAHHAAVL